ncbi:MAG: FG-GAP-like repeat-containing protein [Methylomicrobium sp.]
MTTPNPKIFRRVAAAALSFSGLSAAFAEPIFMPYTAMPTGSWPEATAIGDVNGDGLKDVVMTTSYYFDAENDYKLFVFLQAANGQLQTPIKYATQGTYPSPPQSVDIGDVNGDGKNDVVVGNSRLNIQVFLQDANGNLASSSVHPTQNSTVVKIGDLNGDGRSDVAGIGHGTSNASVLYQNPDGALAPPVSFNAPHGGFDDLDIGDINADNRNDLIVMSGQGYAYNNLAILAQNLSGSFEPAVFYDLGFDVNTSGLGVGDVNGDQLNDVIVSYGGNKPASKIGIFHQQSGVLMPAVSLPSYDIPEPVEVKDVTGDGLSDVVVLHGGWNSLGVYVQTADGSLSPEQLFPIPYASGYNVQGLALGDINDDGLPDAAIADYNYGLVVLYHEPGAETPNNPPLADAGPDQNLQLSTNPLQVVLDGGNSSDPDNDPLTYHWTLSAPSGSNAALNDRALVNPNFTADIAGIYTVQLQVFDGKTYSQADTVTISVLPANLPPIANAGADQTVLQGTQVSLDGSQSKDGEPEPNGTITSWSWTQIGGPAVTLQNATSATASFTAPRLKGQKNLLLTFELTVTDDDGATANDRVQITVVK